MPVINTIKLEDSGITVDEFTDGSILLGREGRTFPTSKVDIASLYFAFFPITSFNDTDDDDINSSAKAENETQEYFNDQM